MLLDINDPQKMGLLSLGLRLMSTPGKFGTALGQAGLGAMGDIQQMKAQQQAQKTRALQEQMLQMQLEKAQADQKRSAAMQEAAKAWFSPGQMLPEGVAGPRLPPQFDVRGFAERMAALGDPSMLMDLQKKAAPIKVGKDDTLLDPMTMKPVFEGKGTPEKEPEAIRALKAIYGENTPEYLQAVRQYGKKMTTHQPATQVQVNTPFENAFSKASGSKFADVYDTINTAGMTAGQQIARLDRMQELLAGVEGGKLAPLGKEIASLANSFGIKLDPNLGNKEAAESLSREIAASFRQPGTGPMTDKDFDNFLLIVPDLSKSSEGRRQISQTLRAKAMRDVQMAQLAQDYVAKNGTLDTGFYKVAQQFIAANPVVQMPSISGDVRSQADQIIRRGP